MRKDLQRHKKSDAIKWVAVALAIVLLSTSMLALLTRGFKNWNVKDWFGKPTQSGMMDGDGNELDPSTVHSLPRNLVVAGAKNATNELNVVATITPSDAANTKVNWIVAFVNPTSAWATGKNIAQYVTATPTSDGALTARISCLQAFGEKITITVQSRDNTKAKATCNVDYVKRLESVNVKLTAGADTKVYNIDGVNSSMGSVINCDPVGSKYPVYTVSKENIFGVGTITDEYTVKVYYNRTANVAKEFSNAGYTINGLEDAILLGSTFQLNQALLKTVFGNDVYTNIPKYNVLSKFIADSGTAPILQFTYEAFSSRNPSNILKSGVVRVLFTVVDFPIRVENITVDNGTMVF